MLQAVSYQFYACMMHANQISFLYNRCQVDYVKLLYADYPYFASLPDDWSGLSTIEEQQGR